MVQRINVALSLLSGFSYGGVTYFRNLIPSLANQDKFNRYHIFVPAGHDLLTRINQDNFFFHEVQFDPKSPFFRHFWEQFVLPREIRHYGIDVLFTAKNGNVFLAPCKTVIAIQNVEPFYYMNYENEWFLNVGSSLRNLMTVLSIRKADKVIAVSNAVKEHLGKKWPFLRERIVVIYNGNPVMPSPRTNDILPSTSPFLLSASKFVAYANQLNLVRAYALLLERGRDLPPLWFAGGIHDKRYFGKVHEEVREKGIEDRVRFLGLIPHEELLRLYGRAHAFLFPSTLEACPHTLIEAMACGVPVAASHTPPMPEIGGNGALYFDPYDVGDMAEKIETLVQNLDLCQALRVKGLARSMCFDWEKTAAALIRVFEDVALGSSGHCPDQVGSRAQ